MKKDMSSYIIFLRLVIFIFIIKEFFFNYKLSILYSICLVFFIISYKLKNKIKLKKIYFLENLVYLLIYSYEFNLLYKNIPFWDTAMHAFTGFISCIFILICFKFYKKIKIPILIAFFSFCFSLTTGLLFELYEYSIDNIFYKDMQKDMIVDNIQTVKLSKNEKDLKEIFNIYKTIIYYKDKNELKEIEIKNGYLDIGINDTMKDLYVNFIGSIMGSLYVYFCLTYKKKDNK